MVKLPQETMNQKEIREAQERVAMRSLDHFRQWLIASGREFLIFNSKDLLNSLEFAPDNLVLVQQIVDCYRQHRLDIPYSTRKEIEPMTGETITVPICKDDTLTIAETDRLVRILASTLFDKVPGWSLDSEPIG